jgi:hypothetical protein
MIYRQLSIDMHRTVVTTHQVRIITEAITNEQKDIRHRGRIGR